MVMRKKTNKYTNKKRLNAKELNSVVDRVMMSPTIRPRGYDLYLEKERDGILCHQCGTILVSYYTHDYKTCQCENSAMVDGGSDYLRYGAIDIKKISVLSIKLREQETA